MGKAKREHPLKAMVKEIVKVSMNDEEIQA